MREIAAAVELSQAGLMHYFASKDELFTEILPRRDEVDAALVSNNPDTSMLDAIPLVIKHNAGVPGLVQLPVSFAAEATAPGHFAQTFFNERFERFRREIAGEIHLGQANGGIRSDIDADLAARSLLALADGLQNQWLLNPDFDMAAHVSFAIDAWRSES